MYNIRQDVSLYHLSSERVSCLWRGGTRWEEPHMDGDLQQINRKSLRLIEKLGEGKFGMVSLVC
jgi:hypothetical protein